jgi:hypothetical protein
MITTPVSILVDHIIVAVLDRDVAARDYNTLGFKTIVGGTHPDGHTHNCLVPLAQGPYIELVSPTDVSEIRVRHEDHNRHWLYCFNAGQGFAGYALAAPNIDPVVERLKAGNYELNGPRVGGRDLPDGRKARGRGINIKTPRYPAVTSDETPREWRIPTTPENSTHENGVTGVEHVIAMVKNLEDGVARYEAITGAVVERGEPISGARTANFRVDNALLTIAEPTDTDSAMYEDLQLRGEVPFLVRLKTTKPEKRGLLNRTLTHHARFELV